MQIITADFLITLKRLHEGFIKKRQYSRYVFHSHNVSLKKKKYISPDIIR